MTKVVVVCAPDDTVNEVMSVMTKQRFRHLPVQDGQKLVGIISIGDVMKHRLSEVQLEADVLRDYARVQR
jgi:CBS domain-containing protein